MSDELLEAIQRAAKGLPEGYQVILTVERGAGWVELENIWHNVDFEPNPDESFACQIHHAINQAIEAVQ